MSLAKKLVEPEDDLTMPLTVEIWYNVVPEWAEAVPDGRKGPWYWSCTYQNFPLLVGELPDYPKVQIARIHRRNPAEQLWEFNRAASDPAGTPPTPPPCTDPAPHTPPAPERNE